MSFDILVPSLPESVSDATLVAWHKQPGDWVDAGDNLADLETDKVILEVPAPNSGILKQIVKTPGDIVLPGELLATLDIQASKQTQAKPAVKDEAPLSPSVRKLVAENELNPTVISGSGKHGRILKTDVLDYLNEQQVAPEEPTPAAETSHAPLSATAVASLRPEQRVPMTRLRAKVAERLLQAQQNAAMLTTSNEVNLKSVIDLRNQYKERFEAKHNVKLGF
ncbi:partial Dihydrolipoyllysine-residue succinyltransferase component of 2-oxoglutarate dehydrogenase complex, partial [Anaerolineae bacterium]